MAIAALPSAAALGFKPAPGTSRNFVDVSGNRVSRRQADNVRAQAAGYKSIADYNKAAQADRVASGNATGNYDASGKDVKAKEAREASVFKVDSAPGVVRGMGGKTVPTMVDKITYTGKANPLTALDYGQRLDKKIDKAEDKILEHVKDAQVARIVVTIWDDNGGKLYASSPLMTSADFAKEVAMAGGLANYADEIAHSGGQGSSITGGAVVIGISVTSTA